MNYYGLKDASTNQILEGKLSIQPTSKAAVAEFSHELGSTLTLEDVGTPPVYFMSENPGGGPNWIAYDIPVYETANPK